MPLTYRRKTLFWGSSVLSLSALFGGAASAQTRGAGSAATGQHQPVTTGRELLTKRPYLIQPGDAISVSFRYTPEFNEDVVVGPDGRATFKAAGSVNAAGMSVSGLESAIAENSRTKLVNPEVSVTLKDFDRPHVFVAGEVNTPGRQDLRHPTTVLQAILMCGGPKEDAALGRVYLFRRIDADTAEVHVLKLARFDRKTRGENDMLLEPDDMILLRRDLPSRIERYVKLTNLGIYLNPLQNTTLF